MAMHPEEHLDALLTVQLHEPEAASVEVPGDLMPLLAVAAKLDRFRQAEPDPTFARALEQRWLARAEHLAAATVEHLAAETSAAGARELPARERLRQAVGRRSRTPRWALLAAAAVLLFSVGAGTLTAAAAAMPGTPLYGLHRLEQGMQAQFAVNVLDQGHLHLTYAEQALSALSAAAAQHNMSAYHDALATLRDEWDSAHAALGQVPTGQAHDALAADLAQVTTQARAALLAVAPTLAWQEQLATTNALGAFGQPVPVITRARIMTHDSGDHRAWVIALSGSGFQAGAQVVLEGQVMSGAALVSADALQFTLVTAPRAAPHTVGIQNPDGTVAETTQVLIAAAQSGDDTSSRPTPAGTDDAGKNGQAGSGSGGTHGGGYATPSAVPTVSPTDR
jgi:hypothetical protein